MTMIASIAENCGFKACWMLRPDKFVHYERRLLDGALHEGGADLVYDLATAYPWANAILTLIWPYKPFSRQTPLCSNYIPANTSYHAVEALLPKLAEAGVRAERVYVPVRELLVRSGFGVALKNGLTAVPPYGTRFAIQTLAIDAPSPRYDDRGDGTLIRCGGCDACAESCPVGAIGEDGFDFHKCIRAYMGKDPMPEWVMAHMVKLLGCEECQYACPYNAGIEELSELPEAFYPERLLKNDLRAALEQVGFNQKSGGRLQAHAAVIAAKANRRDLLPELEKLREDPREAVRLAAAHAISRLHNGESMV